MDTFLTVFAGRRRYLEISRIYFDLLLERGTVTEVHLWDKVSTVRSYFGMFLRHSDDDEAFFSADVCALTGAPNLIVPSFSVVHYLFEPQAQGSQRNHYLPAYRQPAETCRDECAAARARATHPQVPG